MSSQTGTETRKLFEMDTQTRVRLYLNMRAAWEDHVSYVALLIPASLESRTWASTALANRLRDELSEISHLFQEVAQELRLERVDSGGASLSISLKKHVYATEKLLPNLSSLVARIPSHEGRKEWIGPNTAAVLMKPSNNGVFTFDGGRRVVSAKFESETSPFRFVWEMYSAAEEVAQLLKKLDPAKEELLRKTFYAHIDDIILMAVLYYNKADSRWVGSIIMSQRHIRELSDVLCELLLKVPRGGAFLTANAGWKMGTDLV